MISAATGAMALEMVTLVAMTAAGLGIIYLFPYVTKAVPSPLVTGQLTKRKKSYAEPNRRLTAIQRSDQRTGHVAMMCAALTDQL